MVHSIPTDITHIIPTQVRAARVLLGWSAAELAVKAGVGTATVSRLEMAEEPLAIHRLTVRAVLGALSQGGASLSYRIDGGLAEVTVRVTRLDTTAENQSERRR